MNTARQIHPKPRILIVEDDLITLRVAREMFTCSGFEVVTLNDSALAPELFRLQQFDLVVLDYYMPDANGYETAESLRELEKQLNRTPVPMVVVSGSINDIHNIHNKAVTAWYSKPYSLATIQHLMDTYLSRDNVHAAKPQSAEIIEYPSPF